MNSPVVSIHAPARGATYSTSPTTSSPDQKQKLVPDTGAGLADVGGHAAADVCMVGYSDCGCGAGFEPGVVLDIFAGSGTACLVAKEFGRSWVGIDLNDTYINDIAWPRLMGASI